MGVRHKERGEIRTGWRDYHRIVAVAMGSLPFPAPLGIRFQKDGEVLYLQAPFVRAVERLGWDWACTVKENRPELPREAERFTTGPPAAVQSESDQELRRGHLPPVDRPVADHLVPAIHLELGAIAALSLDQLTHNRWCIDAGEFQTITIDGHLKHPAIHTRTALVVRFTELRALRPGLLAEARVILKDWETCGPFPSSRRVQMAVSVRAEFMVEGQDHK